MILIIIAIASYILYRLYNRRISIIATENKNPKVEIEGFTNSVVSNLQNANKTELNVVNFDTSTINSKNGYNNQNLALELKQYCIKSSYKTAFNGTDVSTDMIKYVLERGCRFIDLDLFYDNPSTTLSPNSTSKCSVVSYCENPDDTTSVESSPTYTKITFSNVCSFISQHAFSTVPNGNDPLFVQLNLNCLDKSKKSVFYQNVAESIMTGFLTNQLYQGQVDSNTSINKLMKKVVFVMNNRLCSDYKNSKYATGGNYILMNYINMNNSGDPTTSTMLTINYDIMKTNAPSPIQIHQTDGNSGNDVINANFNQVLPIEAKTMMTQNIPTLSTTYNTVNIIPMMFWMNDAELVKYETMFTKQKRAIVPMGKLYKYLSWYKQQYASF